jgi:hypothetical protein
MNSRNHVNHPFENWDSIDKAKCFAFGKEILAEICKKK